MNVLEAIYARKSIRKFKDEIVPKEDILKMLEAATQAPSPKHQQNWNFVVVTNRELINKMADIVTASHEKLGEIAKTEKDRKIHNSSDSVGVPVLHDSNTGVCLHGRVFQIRDNRRCYHNNRIFRQGRGGNRAEYDSGNAGFRYRRECFPRRLRS